MIFILILLLSILSYNAVFYLQSLQIKDGAVIDAAGMNRMLTQRIGFYAEQAAAGNEEAKADLKSIIRLHDTSFFAIKNGGVVPGLANNRFLPAAPDSMAHQIAETEESWLRYRQHAETIANSATGEDVSTAILAIERSSDEMLKKDTDLVNAYVVLNYRNQLKFSIFLLATLIVNVIAILAAFKIARSISHPLQELKTATEQVEKGNFKTRVNFHTGDEIEELGDTFNKTTEALERMDEEYKRVDRTKTKFLSITSHELRSPMTSMKAQMQMLLKGYFGKLNSKQNEAVDIVLRNTVRLDNIIVDFLDISRIEAARLKFDFRKTSLEPHIKRLVKEMKGFLPEKKIGIVLKMEKLPEMEVDPDRTMQVLRNLMNNAMKFSPEKSKVVVSVIRKGKEIVISVSDSGIGISKEDQEKIFEPFFQAEQTMYRKYRGTGLGLSICRGIIESQKGKLMVESVPGKGSTFIFTVPLKPVREVEPINVIFSEEKK